GMKIGDSIVSIDENPIDSWDDIQQAIALSFGRSESGQREIDFVVKRDGELIDLTVRPIISEDMEIRQVGLAPGYTVIAAALFPNAPATRAGMDAGDIIVSVDGHPVRSEAFYRTYIADKAGQELPLVLLRDGKEITTSIVPEEVVV